MVNEKRLIDANALQRLLLPIATGLEKEYGSLGGAVSGVMLHIDNAPTVDAVEVVRCKDCKWAYRDKYSGVYFCHERQVRSEHFCSYGERRQMEKRCSNCANCKYRSDGERKLTDTCAKCNWIKVSENKEPSNWKPAKEEANGTDKV